MISDARDDLPYKMEFFLTYTKNDGDTFLAVKEPDLLQEVLVWFTRVNWKRKTSFSSMIVYASP